MESGIGKEGENSKRKREKEKKKGEGGEKTGIIHVRI